MSTTTKSSTAMNQRVIKFRVWDNVDYMSKPFTLYDLMGSQAKIEFTHDCIVMQYTGLNDKDGQEIYEGDVVKADGLLPSTIIFYESAFRTEKAAEPLAYDAERYGGLTVIGNIYEHPELLQQ